MAGTRKGGKKAAVTNKLRYGEDYYHNLGKSAGSAPRREDSPRGFAALPQELAQEIGRRGGIATRDNRRA